MFRYLIALSILVLGSSTAWASKLVIQGAPQLEFRRSGVGLVVEGSYSILNSGDEVARDVFPLLEVENKSWSGEPREIAPGASFSWNVTLELSDSKIEGLIPVRVSRFYKDLNQHQFSAKDLLVLATPDLSMDQRTKLHTPTLISRLLLASTGQRFDGRLELRNVSAEELTPTIELLFPLELSFEVSGRNINITPGQTIDLKISGRNLTAFPGSNYPVLALISWEKDGLSHAIVAMSGIDIFTEDNANERVGLGSVLLIGAVILIVMISRVAKRSA